MNLNQIRRRRALISRYMSPRQLRLANKNRLKIVSNNALGIVSYVSGTQSPRDEVSGDMIRASDNKAFLAELEFEKNRIHVPEKLIDKYSKGCVYFYTAIAKAIKKSEKDYLTYTRKEMADLFDINITSIDRYKNYLIKDNYIRHFYSKKDKTYKLYIEKADDTDSNYN